MTEGTKFYIDEKVSVWRRTYYEINEELNDEQLIGVMTGKSEKYPGLIVIESNFLYETENGVSTEKNGGDSTMKLFNMEDKLIWCNEKK